MDNSTGRKVILVIDDSATDLALVQANIRREKPAWEILTAENGETGMSIVADSPPDAVVTDLRMPNMDGLELTARIKREYPNIPVVIVSARGSEGLAVEALSRGAASYVPKNQIAERLVETIDQVLDRATANHSYQRLISSLERTEYRFTLENDPALIPPLVDLLQQMSFGMNLVDANGRQQLGICLDEALWNAMYHGNLDLPPAELANIRRQVREGARSEVIDQRRQAADYSGRRVRVRAVLTREEAVFVISDDGMGFHPNNIPEARDPTVMENDGGRGLVLMMNLMDEVRFNELGSEVTLVKRRAAPDELA